MQGLRVETKGSATGDRIAGPFKDPSQDLLHLALTKGGGAYTLRALVGDRAWPQRFVVAR